MTNKRIISLACAGAIILAGVGGASAITAHNASRAAALAEEESLAALTTTDSTSTSIDTPIAGTTAAPATAAKTTTAEQGGSKITTEVETTKITWTYDAKLTQEVCDLMVKTCPNIKFATPKIRTVKIDLDSWTKDAASIGSLYIDLPSKNPAKQIVDKWAPYIVKHPSSVEGAEVSVFVSSNADCIASLTPVMRNA